MHNSVSHVRKFAKRTQCISELSFTYYLIINLIGLYTSVLYASFTCTTKYSLPVLLLFQFFIICCRMQVECSVKKDMNTMNDTFLTEQFMVIIFIRGNYCGAHTEDYDYSLCIKTFRIDAHYRYMCDNVMCGLRKPDAFGRFSVIIQTHKSVNEWRIRTFRPTDMDPRIKGVIRRPRDKGDNILDFLFALLYNKSLLNRGLL